MIYLYLVAVVSLTAMVSAPSVAIYVVRTRQAALRKQLAEALR